MHWDYGRRNDFQIEVGLADLSWGLVGLTAWFLDWGYEGGRFDRPGVLAFVCLGQVYSTPLRSRDQRSQVGPVRADHCLRVMAHRIPLARWISH